MVDLPLPANAPAADALSGTSPAADAGEDAFRRIASRVLAWQHRQPLARRLSPQDVVGVGLIALPYGPSAAPGARPGELQPLFHQPRLLPGLSHRALVEFASRHAVAERPGPADWPCRVIERADASSEPAPQTRYLLTAAVNDALAHGVSPRRLLLAPGNPAIWGRRAWSRTRVAIAVAAALLLVAAALVWGWTRGRPAAELPAEFVPPVPSSAAEVASPVARADSAPAVAPPPSQAAASQAAAALPMPQHSTAASAASAPAPSAQPPVPVPVPAGPHYALVSAPSKDRAAAEATLLHVQRLLGPAIGSLQAQIMPSPQGYVVTVWPLPTQSDAEHLAEVLARRGVPMKWMEF